MYNNPTPPSIETTVEPIETRSPEEIAELIARAGAPPSIVRREGEFASKDTEPLDYKRGNPDASFGVDGDEEEE